MFYHFSGELVQLARLMLHSGSRFVPGVCGLWALMQNRVIHYKEKQNKAGSKVSFCYVFLIENNFVL